MDINERQKAEENLFRVMEQIFGGKLSYQTIMLLFYLLRDLIIGSIPQLQRKIKREERITVQIDFLNESIFTKNQLTVEEKELFAFCVWYANCIMIFDEASGNTESGIIALSSTEEIINLFRYIKTTMGYLFIKSM